MIEFCFDIVYFVYVEMYIDKFEESFVFFVNVYGLIVFSQDEILVYLCVFDDYEFYMLKFICYYMMGVGYIVY